MRINSQNSFFIAATIFISGLAAYTLNAAEQDVKSEYEHKKQSAQEPTLESIKTELDLFVTIYQLCSGNVLDAPFSMGETRRNRLTTIELGFADNHIQALRVSHTKLFDQAALYSFYETLSPTKKKNAYSKRFMDILEFISVTSASNIIDAIFQNKGPLRPLIREIEMQPQEKSALPTATTKNTTTAIHRLSCSIRSRLWLPP